MEGIKFIRKKIKEAGIKASVKYLGVGIDEYSSRYSVQFDPIHGNLDWVDPIDIIDPCDIDDWIDYYKKDLLKVITK